jgi:Raf kinase inhibitor-like YbhB/YbcL family protein
MGPLRAANIRTGARRFALAGALSALAVAVAVPLSGCGSSGGSGSTAASVSSASGQSSTTSTSGSAGSPTSASATSTTTSSSASATSSQSASAPSKPVLASLALSSPAFPRGGKIPTRYTCDGANESPPLRWNQTPAGTVQQFLFALDLAGGQNGAIRWAVGGISPSVRSLAAGHVPPGAIVGRNSTGSVGYAGVCPPRGATHDIIFLLYALRTKLNVAPGFDPRTVQRQLSGHTAAAGLMFGIYKRP